MTIEGSNAARLAAAGAVETANEVVVFSDLAECYLDIEGKRALRHRSEAGMVSAPDYIERFTLGEGVRSGSVAVKHFDFKRPRIDLSCSAKTGKIAD